MSDVVKAARNAPGVLLAGGGRAVEGLARRLGEVTGLWDTRPACAAEEVDVGAPIDVVYDEWVRFQKSSDLLRASHVVHEVLDDRIVWEADPGQGYADGAVTFHELAPGLTRVLVVVACDSPGLLDRVVGRWNGPARRVRAELGEFRVQVTTRVLVEPEEGREPEGNAT